MRSGLHKFWYPGIRDTSTWSKFRAHGEHGDVFLFSNLGALWFSENLIRYSLHVCLREVKKNLFPSNTLIYGISRDGSKNFNIRTSEYMILGKLRMGARQAKNAPLCTVMYNVFSSQSTWPQTYLKSHRLKSTMQPMHLRSASKQLLI